jgi:putative heme iron utilization protein
MGIDMEKVLEAGFTGINTRAGDLMSIRFDHKSNTPTDWAQTMHIVLTADCILEVKDSGVTVFD